MAQIAKQLNLAESTARFYRDRFEDFIPSIGEGRKKRYKPETIEGVAVHCGRIQPQPNRNGYQRRLIPHVCEEY